VHELSIAEGILDQVERLAAHHHATRVDAVEIETGVMRMVEHGALRSAFEVVTKGTIAEGAELAITDIPVAARCRSCGAEYDARGQFDFTCPSCGKAAADVVRGNDIILASVEMDAPVDEQMGERGYA
jgi:hydrogenase nickel incorporation protein HypA/HybF